MRAAEVWGKRWAACTEPLQRRWMEVAAQKRSLVVLAADRRSMSGLIDLIDAVSGSVAALKTHVDLVDDWSPESWHELCARAAAADMLIMEDRKFADISGISRDQMAGAHDVRSWADLVTAHLISGPDIISGLLAGWGEVGREGGVMLLAQMSSRENLLDRTYTERVVGLGREAVGCFGFIGNGSRPDELRRLRAAVGEARMIWTPGVNLAVGDGEMGQRYGDPGEAVLAGSDGIIVGGGIHSAADPGAAAVAYAEMSWNALLKRAEDEA